MQEGTAPKLGPASMIIIPMLEVILDAWTQMRSRAADFHAAPNTATRTIRYVAFFFALMIARIIYRVSRVDR